MTWLTNLTLYNRIAPNPIPQSETPPEDNTSEASVPGVSTQIDDPSNGNILLANETTAGELEHAAGLFAERTPSSSNQGPSADAIAARLDELEAEFLSNEDRSISAEGERVLREIFARTRRDPETSDNPNHVIANFQTQLSLWAATEELVAYEGVLLEEGLPARLMEQLESQLEDSEQLARHQERIDSINEYIDAAEPYAQQVILYGHLLEGLDPDNESDFHRLPQTHPFIHDALWESPLPYLEPWTFSMVAAESSQVLRQLVRVNHPLSCSDLNRLPELIDSLAGSDSETRQAGFEYLAVILEFEEATRRRDQWNHMDQDVGLMLAVREQMEVISTYEQSQNEGEVLLASLHLMGLFGTGVAPRRHQLLEFQGRLRLALTEGDQGAVDAIEEEIREWIPGYMESLYQPADWRERSGMPMSGNVNATIDFLTSSHGNEITVRDIALFSSIIALDPHTSDFSSLAQMQTDFSQLLYNPDEADFGEVSLAVNQLTHQRMLEALDRAYGSEALANGLPPEDEGHGDHAMALASYFSRPVADAYTAFRDRDASSWEGSEIEFRHLLRMASIVDRMNALWDVREIVGQYNDVNFIDWDEIFLEDESLAHLRAFGEETHSRLNYLDGALTRLANASTPEEMEAALAEADHYENVMASQFGSEWAYFDQLLGNENYGGQVQQILEMNRGRDGMVNLIETAVLTVVTFGAMAFASRISSLIIRGWRVAGGVSASAELAGFRGFLAVTRGVNAAGQATRWGRLVSAIEMGGLFNTGRMIFHPEDYVNPDSTTWQNLGRIAFSYGEWIGTFGVFDAIARPFQSLARALTQMRRSAPGFLQKLGYGVAEAGVVTLEMGAELMGEMGEEVVVGVARNAINPYLGDDVIPFGEMMSSLFSAEGLQSMLTQTAFFRGGHMVVNGRSNAQPNVDGETIYGPHYYMTPGDFAALPETGAILDGATCFPTIPDIRERNLVLDSGATIRFTGRVFGQGGASTVYEAILTNGSGESTVAVKIPDHAQGNLTDVNDGMAGEITHMQWAEAHDIPGAPHYYGQAEIDGMTAVVTDVAPGVHVSTQGSVDPSWINHDTLTDLFMILGRFSELGRGTGDFQYTIDRAGRIHLMDFEGAFGNGAPSRTLARELAILRDIWGHSRDLADFDAMVESVRAEFGFEDPDANLTNIADTIMYRTIESYREGELDFYEVCRIERADFETDLLRNVETRLRSQFDNLYEFVGAEQRAAIEPLIQDYTLEAIGEVIQQLSTLPLERQAEIARDMVERGFDLRDIQRVFGDENLRRLIGDATDLPVTGTDND